MSPSLVILAIARRLLLSSPTFSVCTFSPPPGASDEGVIFGLQPLETNIDAFRSVIDYRLYRLTDRPFYIDADADLFLNKVKRMIDFLYPNVEPFSGKDAMENLGFLYTMTESFNGQLLSEGLETRSLVFSLASSTQTGYSNVVYPITHDP